MLPNSPGIVIDTNTFVSAVLSRYSAPARGLDIIEERGELIVSDEIINELNDVLHRPKFDLLITSDVRDRFLLRIRLMARYVRAPQIARLCRDPKDDVFLAVALAGKADALVTGDRDLLVLHPFRGIPILSPRAFLDVMTSPR